MVLGNLISIIVVLVVVGLCLYLLETYIPLAEPIKLIIRVVVVLFLVLWLLSAFGVWNGFSGGGTVLRR